MIDWDAVRAHVTGTIAAIAPMDSEARFRALGAEVLRGEARFLDPDTLGIDGRRLTARRIVIAAGSRAAVPPIPGLDAVPFLTNETLFTLAHPPEHLLVLGGGPLGLEMATAHAGLGCRVTLVEAGRIAPREDPELADGLRRAIADPRNRARRDADRRRVRRRGRARPDAGPGGRAAHRRQPSAGRRGPAAEPGAPGAGGGQRAAPPRPASPPTAACAA